MTLQEQKKQIFPVFCEYCGKELKNGRCFCTNSQNEVEQFDEYTGLPLEKD